MYLETIEKVSKAAVGKAAVARSTPIRYTVAAMLAGMYVGFGIILIFSIGAPFFSATSPATKLVMGTSFGIALTLVIMAGSELFTGLNLVMTCGLIRREVRIQDIVRVWSLAWFGNLVGSLAIAWIFSKTGFATTGDLSKFFNTVSAQKMNAPFIALFSRAILCNMLVCLAVWMLFRLVSETAKLITIFWCLFAFIGSGFEHSIANMSLLAIPLFSGPLEGVSWFGYMRNLVIVTFGNAIGGALLIGGVYCFISIKRETSREN